MSNPLVRGSAQITDGSGHNMAVNADGSINVTGGTSGGSGSTLSSSNNSTANLGTDALFTGGWEDVSGYQSVVVTYSADTGLSGMTAGLRLEWSTDGVTVHHTTHPIAFVSDVTAHFPVMAKYVRVKVTNGGSAATTRLALQTYFSPNRIGEIEPVQMSRFGVGSAQLARDFTGPVGAALGLALDDSTGYLYQARCDTSGNLAVRPYTAVGPQAYSTDGGLLAAGTDGVATNYGLRMKGASTAALAADPALVVTESPNSNAAKETTLSSVKTQTDKLTFTGAALQVTGGGGGTEYVEDAASTADPLGQQLMARRRDTLATETSTDGDNTALNSTAKGELYVKHTDTIPVTQSTASSLKAEVWGVTKGVTPAAGVTVAAVDSNRNAVITSDVNLDVALSTIATAARQDTGNTSLAAIATALASPLPVSDSYNLYRLQERQFLVGYATQLESMLTNEAHTSQAMGFEIR